MNIYISGQEQTSGKTMIAAGLASVLQSLEYKAGVYKPIQTGAIDKRKYLVSPDLAFVKILDKYITVHSTYMYKTKSLPITCEKLENIEINIENLVQDYRKLSKKTDILITEATGGLMTPLKNNIFDYDIPLKLKLPVVFVVTPGINNLNNYLNEINIAKIKGLDIAGVIINKYPLYSEAPDVKAFPELIEKYTDSKVLGLIRNFKGKSVQANILFNEILNGIDIEDVFRMKIPKLHSI